MYTNLQRIIVWLWSEHWQSAGNQCVPDENTSSPGAPGAPALPLIPTPFSPLSPLSPFTPGSPAQQNYNRSWYFTGAIIIFWRDLSFSILSDLFGQVHQEFQRNLGGPWDLLVQGVPLALPLQLLQGDREVQLVQEYQGHRAPLVSSEALSWILPVVLRRKKWSCVKGLEKASFSACLSLVCPSSRLQNLDNELM